MSKGMVGVYYTVQVALLAAGHPDKWRLTITRCVSDGASVTEQELYFERFFDSREAAIQYGSTWAALQGATVIEVRDIPPTAPASGGGPARSAR